MELLSRCFDSLIAKWSLIADAMSRKARIPLTFPWSKAPQVQSILNWNQLSTWTHWYIPQLDPSSRNLISPLSRTLGVVSWASIFSTKQPMPTDNVPGGDRRAVHTFFLLLLAKQRRGPESEPAFHFCASKISRSYGLRVSASGLVRGSRKADLDPFVWFHIQQLRTYIGYN